MQPSHESLSLLFKSGEIAFFETLYKTYFQRTLYFCRQYLADPEEAREVAQDTFVAVWEKRHDLREDLSVQAFILTIARNKCLNVLRKKMTEQKYADALERREMMANYSALSDDAFGSVQMQELEQLVEDGLAELPEKTRAIYEMNRDQELTYEEIARNIGMSVKSVEYHISKALAYMRHKLKDYLMLLSVGCMLLFL